MQGEGGDKWLGMPGICGSADAAMRRWIERGAR